MKKYCCILTLFIGYLLSGALYNQYQLKNVIFSVTECLSLTGKNTQPSLVFVTFPEHSRVEHFTAHYGQCLLKEKALLFLM